jgi:hypothetical protein
MFETPVHLLQPQFSRGEVSPLLFGRVDTSAYIAGLRTLRNAFVRPEGAVSNRPGLAFTGNALSNTSKATILVPFIFSATQSYVLEIGALSAQVFSGGAIVGASATVNVTAAVLVFLTHPGGWRVEFTTSAPHGLSPGQNINISGIIGTGSFAVNGPNIAFEIIDSTHFTVLASFGNTGVYTSGGVISSPLNFVTPWAAADLPLLRWSQSSDTLTLVHPKYPPYEIKRTSANSFTCLPGVYVNGPFLSQNTDGVTFMYASAKSGTVTITASAPVFNANQVGGLLQLTQQDLSVIEPWEPSKLIGTGTAAVTGLYRRANLKNYISASPVVTGSGTYATGTWIPSHSQGTQADGDGNNVAGLAASAGLNWTYQDSGTGIVLITGFTDAQHVTGIVQPNYIGGPGLLPIACVGGPVVVVGPFTFSGTGSTTSFGPLTANTSIDPSKYYVTVGGVYQPPSTYSISATGGGNIVFVAAPAAGTNNIVVEQISALGQTSFWAFGAFSVDQGYPSAVTYFPDRLVFAATPKQPVGVFGSQTSQYHNFQVNNPVLASDAFTVFLNARQLNAISDLIPLSDLLVGTQNIIWRLWAGSTGTAIGPLSISANPQSYYGECPSCASVLFGDSAIFAEYDGRRLRDLIYQFAYDKFLGQELTLYSRHLIPFGTQFQRLAYKPDEAAPFVFGLRSDGVLLCCTYLREQQITGWAHWDTQGTFEDICVVPENTTFGMYVMTNRIINGAQVRYVEHLTSREVATLFDYKFLDCCSTYDGRNTSSTSMTLTGGTTWLAGDVGTLTASGTTGWANFLSSDPSSNNEIWLLSQLTFTSSVGSMQIGFLQSALIAGTYIVTFADGETRTVTVALDGVTCTWTGSLNSGSITTATIRCRLLLTAYISATQCSVRLKDPCPIPLQGLSTSIWTFARTLLTGAPQLAGMPCVAYADGNVIGMSQTATIPNGTITVGANGSITLPYAGGVVQVGLPYLTDFETLSLNEQGQETIRERTKATPVVYLDVVETRNFLVGTDFTNVVAHQERAFEAYTVAGNQQAGMTYTRVASELTSECHSCIRQNMPLPISIRMHIPQVTIGEPIS